MPPPSPSVVSKKRGGGGHDRKELFQAPAVSGGRKKEGRRNHGKEKKGLQSKIFSPSSSGNEGSKEKNEGRSVGQSCPRSIIKGRSTDYFVLGDQQRLDLEEGKKEVETGGKR